ncbi:MAG: hypothetical protein CMN31_18170 [Sandaracinus sp.]|nr:hypothetical protein [Myxococcales bacterium]MAT23502.1 hypothetical protein [Sandaracinus sp.]MBJ73230.1 hypothetical protein [Sandaracinus sp.]
MGPRWGIVGSVSGGLEERLAKLREGYAAKMGTKIDALEAATRDVVREGRAEDIERLWGLAHKLAGTAGSYGFEKLGEVVHEMEDLVAPFRASGAPPRPVCDGLALLMDQARTLAEP